MVGTPFKPGERRVGRAKGTPNKTTVSIKNAFKEAFEELGGAKALARWARENETEFYRLASKLIPTELTGTVEVVDRRAEEVEDDELAAIAAGGRSRTAEASGRPQKPSAVH